MSSNKPKLAIVYGSVCGGCDVSLVNVGEPLADLLTNYDVIYWSIALDGKLHTLEKLERIDVAIYMGPIRTELNMKLAKLIREKADLVVAYGTCAVYGGIPGLGALIKPSTLVETMKSTVTTTPGSEKVVKSMEKEGLKIPPLTNQCLPLSVVVEPDVLVPGCPPAVENVEKLIDILKKYLRGEKPVKGLMLAEPRSLCEECPRRPKDMSKLVIPNIYRLHEAVPKEDKCFLEQGILCLGPITRAGCGHRCIKANMPCAGCMGPVQRVDDVGLKFLSSLASALLADKEKELGEEGLAKLLDKIVDPQGLFYRYTLPTSYLTKLVLKRLRK
ncbi:MAG: hypothetical protein DRO15_02750 [Thermoprotei archaeon]|nr:MAG: hypothetical protein DRO15_02750 [Thermoprotei archaeon]